MKQSIRILFATRIPTAKNALIKMKSLNTGPSGAGKSQWNKLSGSWTDYRDSSGNLANIGKIANFTNQQVCSLMFKKIVEYCVGSSGGVWSDNRVSLNINLCNW